MDGVIFIAGDDSAMFAIGKYGLLPQCVYAMCRALRLSIVALDPSTGMVSRSPADWVVIQSWMNEKKAASASSACRFLWIEWI